MNDDPSETVQSDQDETDIEKILESHGAGGFFEHLEQADAQFLDVTDFEDYADVMREVKRAEFEFMALPPKVRLLFDNKVANWLDAAHDQEKADAIAEAAGVDAEKAPDPPEVPAVTVEPVSKEDE